MITMKLSTAIRVGSKMHAASEHGWNDIGPDGQIRTCALVAAAEGAGLYTIVGNVFMNGPNWIEPDLKNSTHRAGTPPVSDSRTVSVRMPDEWLLVTQALELPPCLCKKFGMKADVIMLIWHLHDMHQWSREAVAEWIATIEVKVEARIAQNEAARQALIREEGIA